MRTERPSKGRLLHEGGDLGRLEVCNLPSVKEVEVAPGVAQPPHGLGGCHPDVAGKGQNAVHLIAEDVDRRLQWPRPSLKKDGWSGSDCVTVSP